MADEIDFKAEDIEDFLNESFMVLDEVEEFREKMDSFDKKQIRERYSPYSPAYSEPVFSPAESAQTEEQSDDEEGEKALDVLNEEKEKEEEEEVRHPYLCLIESFELTIDQKTASNFTVKPLTETKIRIVNVVGDILRALVMLRKAKEISIDFLCESQEESNFMSLMMISTRDDDFIFDIIKLKNNMLLLTEIFINPKIVKILFDADKILEYLQVQFHLYLVNIFDIKKAAQALNNQDTPLNTILKEKYSFDPEENLKNADLKVRPLPRHVFLSCRCTAHYLIGIYHAFKNELLDKNLFEDVMMQCRQASKSVFSPIRLFPFEKAAEELRNHQACELEVLRKLYYLRSSVAKKTNKNANSVLSKTAIMTFASNLFVFEPLLYHVTKSSFLKQLAQKIIHIIELSRTKFNIYTGPTVWRKLQHINFLMSELEIWEAEQSSIKRKLDASSESNQNKQGKVEVSEKKKYEQSSETFRQPQPKIAKPNCLQTNLLRTNPPAPKKPNLGNIFNKKQSPKQTNFLKSHKTTLRPSKQKCNFSTPLTKQKMNQKPNHVTSATPLDQQKTNFITPNRVTSTPSLAQQKTNFVKPNKVIYHTSNQMLNFATSTPLSSPNTNTNSYLVQSNTNQNFVSTTNSTVTFTPPVIQYPNFVHELNTLYRQNQNANIYQKPNLHTNANTNQFMKSSAQIPSLLNSTFLPPTNQTNVDSTNQYCSLGFGTDPNNAGQFSTLANQMPNLIQKNCPGANNKVSRRRRPPKSVRQSRFEPLPSVGAPYQQLMKPSNIPTNVFQRTSTITSGFGGPSSITLPTFSVPKNNFNINSPQNTNNPQRDYDGYRRSVGRLNERNTSGTDRGRFNDIEDIDEKIDTLERKVTESYRSKSSPDSYTSHRSKSRRNY